MQYGSLSVSYEINDEYDPYMLTVLMFSALISMISIVLAQSPRGEGNYTQKYTRAGLIDWGLRLY